MKQLRMSALDRNSLSMLSPGMWRHPHDRSLEYTSLRFWADYARLLERGLFDLMFLADSFGVLNDRSGAWESSIRWGVATGMNDPFMVVPAMAQVTSNLCFGVTGYSTYEPPFLFARRVTTLDQLCDGRLAWNIVTGMNAGGARALGLPDLPAHDDRYDAADDFMELVYKLWEGSWDLNATPHRRDNPVMFADPSRIRAVTHEGPHYRSTAVFPCEPSPQRTPVLFQAGTSERGQVFGATHAECIFLNGASLEVSRDAVTNTRRRAAAMGRDPARLLFLSGVCVVTGRTEAEAREKYDEYKRYVSPDAVLAHLSGALEIDLTKHPLDEPISFREFEGNRTLMNQLTRDPGRTWTLRQMGEEMALCARNLLVVGSASQVADRLIAWADATGVDGFNVLRVVMPDTYEDFIDLVIPELQARGAYKTAYAPGTMREKLGTGDGPLVASTHPAAAHRRAV